jgi:DNA-binding XRE family transcriptional regulator
MNLSIRALENRLKEQEKVGVSKTFLIFLENEQKKPTYDIAYALARALDLDVEKTLRAAYKARADFDKKKERKNLVGFILRMELKHLNSEEIMR